VHKSSTSIEHFSINVHLALSKISQVVWKCSQKRGKAGCQGKRDFTDINSSLEIPFQAERVSAI